MHGHGKNIHTKQVMGNKIQNPGIGQQICLTHTAIIVQKRVKEENIMYKREHIELIDDKTTQGPNITVIQHRDIIIFSPLQSDYNSNCS